MVAYVEESRLNFESAQAVALTPVLWQFWMGQTLPPTKACQMAMKSREGGGRMPHPTSSV